MKHLTDPQPLISKEQAEQDRVAFMESAEEWRRCSKKKHTEEKRYVNGRAKLTHEQVAEIRRLASMGDGARQLARVFGVDHSQISRILAGTAWTTEEEKAA